MADAVDALVSKSVSPSKTPRIDERPPQPRDEPPPPRLTECKVRPTYVPRDLKYVSRKGLCLVFNCESFSGPQAPGSREGTKKDVEDIQRVFGGLGFDVKVINDPKARTMEDMLWDVAMDDRTRHIDSVVCFVLSHGQMGKIYASDECIKLQTLSRPFSSSLAKHLQGKPKIFFVQACQEIGKDYNAAIDGEWSYDIPSHPDTFFGFSTPPGYYSWRNPQTGSYFIQALCKVFEASITDDDVSPDLETLMLAVNRHISLNFESYVPSNEKFDMKKQTTCYMTSLTKKVVFTRSHT